LIDILKLAHPADIKAANYRYFATRRFTSG
jgi:hypothetical protein